MKILSIKNLVSLVLIFAMIFTSCNKEDDNPIDSDSEENSEFPDLDITTTETYFYTDFDV